MANLARSLFFFVISNHIIVRLTAPNPTTELQIGPNNSVRFHLLNAALPARNYHSGLDIAALL